MGLEGSLSKTTSSTLRAVKGADKYDFNILHIMEEGSRRQARPAAKVNLWKTGLEEGAVKWGREEGFEPYRHKVSLPTRMVPRGTPGRNNLGSFSDVRLYVKRGLMQEFEQINAERPFEAEASPVGKLPRLLTAGQVAVGADFVTHAVTLGRGMVATFMEGASKRNLLGATFHPIARVRAYLAWGSAGKDLLRNDPATLRMSADLSKIGVGRSGTEWTGYGGAIADWLDGKGMGKSAKAMRTLVSLAPSTLMSKALHFMDTAAHVASERQRLELVKQGVFEGGTQNQLDFHAKFGIYARGYNRAFVNWFRDHGLGPFAVTGKGQAVEGGYGLLGISGSSAPNRQQAIANRLAGAWGTIGGGLLGAAAINYAFHEDPFPKDVAPGEVLISRDPDGKIHTFDYMAVGGKERGMTNLGIRDALSAARAGQTVEQITGRVMERLWETFSHPFIGPALSTIDVAMSGKTHFPSERQVAPLAEPGQSQALLNIFAAGKQINPTVEALFNGPSRGQSRIKAALGPLSNAAGLHDRTPALSAASESARSLVAGRTPPHAPSAEKRLVRDYQESIRQAIRSGQTPEQAIHSVDIPVGIDANHALRAWGDAKYDRSLVTFRQLSVPQARQVYALATPQERAAWRNEFVSKEANAIVNDISARQKEGRRLGRGPATTPAEDAQERHLSHLRTAYRHARDRNPDPSVAQQIVNQIVPLLPTEAQSLINSVRGMTLEQQAQALGHTPEQWRQVTALGRTNPAIAARLDGRAPGWQNAASTAP